MRTVNLVGIIVSVWVLLALSVLIFWESIRKAKKDRDVRILKKDLQNFVQANLKLQKQIHEMETAKTNEQFMQIMKEGWGIK
jgi:hypothetical protein